MRAPRRGWLMVACLLVGSAACNDPPPPRPPEAPPPEPAPRAEPSDPPPVEPAPPLSLPAIQRRLDPALRAAANAAPGIRSEPGAGNTGRTYEALVRPATAAPPIDMVHAAIASVLAPDPEPFQTGYYREVEPIDDRSVDAIVAALRFEEPAFPETPDEPAARMALASALAREVAAPAARGRVFFARAGWADAEGQSRHGLAFADPQTGQVLWIYVFELWRPRGSRALPYSPRHGILSSAHGRRRREAMKCVLLGGSGEVGRAVARALVASDACSTLTMLGRRSVDGLDGEKVEQIVTDTSADDFETVVEEAARGHDAAISCIGTGSGTASMSEAQLLEVEVVLMGKFARGCKAAGVEVFELLTAVGVDERSSRSRIKYLRVLGKKLDTVMGVGFEKLAVFKPGTIVGNQHTPGWVTPFTALIPDALGWGNIHQDDIAKAFVAHLVKVAPTQTERVVSYENREMKQLIRG